MECFSAQMHEHYKQRLEVLAQDIVKMPVLKTNLNNEIDDLFSNDVLLYGDVSAQLVKEIIDPEQHE